MNDMKKDGGKEGSTEVWNKWYMNDSVAGMKKIGKNTHEKYK
jgi:hypothetical protein